MSALTQRQIQAEAERLYRGDVGVFIKWNHRLKWWEVTLQTWGNEVNFCVDPSDLSVPLAWFAESYLTPALSELNGSS